MLVEQQELRGSQDGRESRFYMDRVNLVMRGDPIDEALIRYSHQINEETTPSQVEQVELVRELHSGSLDVADDLFTVNKGLVAAIAYPYRTLKLDNSDELLRIGAEALNDAALQYNHRNALVSFTEFAAPIIDAALQQTVPWGRDESLLDPSGNPIHSVYRFMSTVRIVSTTADKERKKRQDSERPRRVILLSNEHLLNKLHLSNKEIEQELGVDISGYYRKIDRIQGQLNVLNRSSLALAAIDAGIEFDTMPIPDVEMLTPLEREVVTYLHYPFADIAMKLGSTEKAIQSVAANLRAKLHARSRTEVVVMAKLGGYGPETDDAPEYLRPFTELQRSLIPHLPLESSALIAERTGMTKDAVKGAYSRMLQLKGATSREHLALMLHESGYDFDVKEPENNLSDVFTMRQLFLLQSLHLPNPDIAEILNETESAVRYHISRAYQLTGAENRTQLLLMAHKYADGRFSLETSRVMGKRLEKTLGTKALVAVI